MPRCQGQPGSLFRPKKMEVDMQQKEQTMNSSSIKQHTAKLQHNKFKCPDFLEVLRFWRGQLAIRYC